MTSKIKVIKRAIAFAVACNLAWFLVSDHSHVRQLNKETIKRSTADNLVVYNALGKYH
jgi:isocitrate lyase